MRQYAFSLALASAMLATVVSLPNQASAMTLDALGAAARTQVEQAGWCGRRGCLGRPYYQSAPLRVLLLSALALLQLLFGIGLAHLRMVSVSCERHQPRVAPDQGDAPSVWRISTSDLEFLRVLGLHSVRQGRCGPGPS